MSAMTYLERTSGSASAELKCLNFCLEKIKTMISLR